MLASPLIMQADIIHEDVPVVALASSSNGRVSGKAWKLEKSATVRSQLPKGVKTKRWEDRMDKTKKEQAIKKLQAELRDEKQAEYERRKEVTLERKRIAEEKRRIEEAKLMMGARKAARLRKRAGRSKTVNH
ncbi:hypothetical protein D9611_005781 [Ephemerocybe angulata]|uniref:rRNA-processing protein n=2 Tax=Ephemerocybe angulata TaxID=980116 RepID=A0A8H5BI33_9AGAR|nr:hypothetical protein D9611_005781 [Tulosesus angulatus]